MNYLFSPICEFVESLAKAEIEVRNKNTVGQTGVHTRVPQTTNDLFHSHPDIVAYAESTHYRSLAIVEVKRLPLLKSDKELSFDDPKMVSFFVQVVAEMFSNHTNKGMLTGSYTTILVEIDIERTLEIIKQNTELLDDRKPIALNYKILECHSSGLTLRGGLISFIHEAFNAGETRLNQVKRGLDKIYKYIRKTDEEYLTYLDELADKDEEEYKHFFKDIFKIKGQCLYDTVISLKDFSDIDIQSGLTFNSQLFKIETNDVQRYIKEALNKDDQLMVKVFDPIKAKRDHDDYRIDKNSVFVQSRVAYLREKIAYEKLMTNLRFNSVYIKQECVYGRFNIGRHYHALGPFIILKYLDQGAGRDVLPMDRTTYEKARKQLDIIHYCGIIHGDISRRNILYSQGKIYCIDFGYSNYDVLNERGSRPVSATEERKKSEHEDLRQVFGIHEENPKSNKKQRKV